MSFLLHDPATFADEAAAGFVKAFPSLVRLVPGGVARMNATPSNQVAVVIGGGAGHYPAFAGMVGRGLAHAAAMGSVFASPSHNRVLSAAKSVATDAGVLLSYGNYTGDVLNFDRAAEALLADGIPTRSVQVTDDMLSAPPHERHLRRGIAGDLGVFKIAGWAAEQGLDLDAVAELAERTNARTRSVGVGFSGPTLPGATAPLFEVPEGKMALGIGLHGEPGLDFLPIPTPQGLAEHLVGLLLTELPSDIVRFEGATVAVIVNGLGSVKGEELFVLWKEVEEQLAEHRIRVVDPAVGEFATSFNMAGVSLTLIWLDEELEAGWRAPANTAAFRKGELTKDAQHTAAHTRLVEAPALVQAKTAEAASAGAGVARALALLHDEMKIRADELGSLDATAGDGDHGLGMERGSRSAAEAAQRAAVGGCDAGEVLRAAGEAWGDRAGGTSGALWGAGLVAAAGIIGTSAPTPFTVAAAVEAACREVQRLGRVEVGDKTLLDSLVPFAESLQHSLVSGKRLKAAWIEAAAKASAAAEATSQLIPKRGRARTHRERSVGTPDPGAISFAYAVKAVSAVIDG